MRSRAAAHRAQRRWRVRAGTAVLAAAVVLAGVGVVVSAVRLATVHTRERPIEQLVLLGCTAIFVLNLAALLASLYRRGVLARDHQSADLELNHRLASIRRALLDRDRALAAKERALAHKQSQAEALRRERDFTVAVLDNAVALVVVFDPRGRIIDFNSACQRLTSFTEEEVVGRGFWETLVAPEYVPLYTAELERLKFDDRADTVEVVWVSKYGKWHRLACTTSVLYDRDGNVTFYVASAADVTAQRTHEEHLRKLAGTDPLTGLMNRSALRQALQMAVMQHTTAALLFCDLDRFKAVNDAFGHATGDQLLVAVARRMRESVRSNDTVARMGGDEFVILCPELSPADTQRLARRVRITVEQPYRLPVGEIRVGVSVGTALADRTVDVDAALCMADEAMYRQKVLASHQPRSLAGYVPHLNGRAGPRAGP